MVTISRATFEELILPKVEETIIVRKGFKGRQTGHQPDDEVIMVGG